METARLSVPITLPTARANAATSSGRASTVYLAEESCSRATVSTVVSWGYQHKPFSADQQGVVLGCTDGSIYIFHATPSHSKHSIAQAHVTPPSPIAKHVRPSTTTTSSLSARSLASTSRSTSPSPSLRSWRSPSPSAPLALAPHARAVSGVTSQTSRVSVEAPKNYVDYDDEPDKLKEILAKGGVRERSIVDGLMPNFKPDFPIAAAPASASKKDGMLPMRRPTRKETERLSAARSPPLSTRSLSPPSSPELAPSFGFDDTDAGRTTLGLSLRLHIVPSRMGPGNSVSGMHILFSTSSVLVLQENGWVIPSANLPSTSTNMGYGPVIYRRFR